MWFISCTATCCMPFHCCPPEMEEAAMQLRDKKVLLTGASGGIGKALAVALAQEGARLVLAGRHVDRLVPVAHDLKLNPQTTTLVELDLGSMNIHDQALQ